MNEPNPPTEPNEPEGRERLLWRVVRSALAPDVLDDGGHDAPLTARGRLWFWGTIVVLTVAVAILFVITLAQR